LSGLNGNYVVVDWILTGDLSRCCYSWLPRPHADIATRGMGCWGLSPDQVTHPGPHRRTALLVDQWHMSQQLNKEIVPNDRYIIFTELLLTHPLQQGYFSSLPSILIQRFSAFPRGT